jgi:hypothetical protein
MGKLPLCRAAASEMMLPARRLVADFVRSLVGVRLEWAMPTL